MIYAGYALTALNYVLYCISRFQKNKRSILILDIFAKICTVLSFFLLSVKSGMISMLISLAAIIVFTIRDKNKIAYGVFFASYIACAVYTFTGLPEIILAISSILMLTANCFFEGQGIRFTGIIVSVLYLGFQISVKNYAGLLEIFVLIANIVSFIKYKRIEERKDERET